MMITSSGNHLFANKGFRPDLALRIQSLSASYTKLQQNRNVLGPAVRQMIWLSFVIYSRLR
jgi:hypothetical protein